MRTECGLIFGLGFMIFALFEIVENPECLEAYEKNATQCIIEREIFYIPSPYEHIRFGRKVYIENYILERNLYNQSTENLKQISKKKKLQFIYLAKNSLKTGTFAYRVPTIYTEKTILSCYWSGLDTPVFETDCKEVNFKYSLKA